jgi:hypothetical protein
MVLINSHGLCEYDKVILVNRMAEMIAAYFKFIAGISKFSILK